MDGHFVPSSTIGLLIVEAIRPVTSLPVNIHWMIDHPDTYIEVFADASADIISVHVEAAFLAWHTAHNEKVYPMGIVVTWMPTSPEQVRRNRSDLM